MNNLPTDLLNLINDYDFPTEAWTSVLNDIKYCRKKALNGRGLDESYITHLFINKCSMDKIRMYMRGPSVDCCDNCSDRRSHGLYLCVKYEFIDPHTKAKFFPYYFHNECNTETYIHGGQWIPIQVDRLKNFYLNLYRDKHMKKCLATV